MDLGLRGKSALIGGGSEGLGRGTAEVLAEEGVRLAIYGLDDEALAVAQRELSEIAGEDVLAIPCDVRSADDCERAVTHAATSFGGLDLMLTNMAGSYDSPFPEDDEAWAEAWEMWSMGPIRLMRHAVPVMRQGGGGSIVHLNSCGVHQTIEQTKFSDVPRFALTAHSKFQADELAAEGIRVNSVLPGWVMTPRSRKRFEEEAALRGVTAGEIEAEEAAVVPMGRFATVREVGNAVAFLFSDAASYITGTTLRVDGGWCRDPIH